MEDSDTSRPQVSQSEMPPPAGDASAPDELNFENFKPGIKESALPPWLHLTLRWLFGMGAVAAIVGAAVFVMNERKTNKTLELLAMNSRTALEGHAVQAQARVDKLSTDMAFVKNTPPRNGERAVQPTASADAAAKPSATPTAASSDAQAATVQSKQVVKKKRPKRKKAIVLAKRAGGDGAPRRRGLSTTERLNAAMAACRANVRGPGQCNIRACDVLGNSHPACRD